MDGICRCIGWSYLEVGEFYMKAPIATAVAIAVGLVVLAGYFLRSVLDPTLSILTQWAITLAGVASVVGIVNLLVVHWKKAQTGAKGSWYSWAALLAFLVTFVAGIVLGPADQHFQLVVTSIQVPVEASLMALLVVTLAVASFWLIRRRSLNLLSASFIVSILIFLILNIGYVTSYLSSLNSPLVNGLIDGIRQLPVGGTRGILIGIALGTLATGLRILVGGDRPYSG